MQYTWYSVEKPRLTVLELGFVHIQLKYISSPEKWKSCVDFSTAAFEAFRAVTQTLYNSMPFQDVQFEFETRLSKDGITRAEESFVAYKGGVKSETQECNPSTNSISDISCPSIVKVLNVRAFGGDKYNRSKSVSTPKSIGNLPRRININRKCIDVAINTDICYSDTKILDNLPDKEKQLKAKERELANKESALKVKERTLNDTSKKLAAAQSYIYTLEKKIEELEQSLLLSERAKMSRMSTEIRFNLLENKVGQFLNGEKSIVKNNNNYGPSYRHALSQEGSDTPVYNIQAAEGCPSTQDTVSQNSVIRGVSVDTNDYTEPKNVDINPQTANAAVCKDKDNLINASCNVTEQNNTANQIQLSFRKKA
ncbi:unnamed protein product [Mytilus coruscus]|uniref:Uncharacterized protein n=1 Tax=Mytilus coruscus TaxID=42192 RepID=A0A6J8BNZ5_MYTCO|nr:unnamed protein product [Mytilus coruscus]